ncbi:hypothetical protein GCM10023340_38770 [Nocardioides marinquilinus]|uniref:DNA-directed DNA polymerase n=1 Tax=Nocardioides marinquilinus TaxID=1210400 RepID=A0ABP9Q290_9ACTN
MTDSITDPTHAPDGQPDQPSQPATPFRDAVLAYAQAGWPCVLPVPPETKSPPPTGFTGAEGRDTDPNQLAAWLKSHATSSIALRMPDHVIGIDVDQYVKGEVSKHGAETLASFEQQWGPLPPTWSSTARGDQAGPGLSRILLFRVPAQRYATRLSTGGPNGTGDVEIIQRHHRYAVVWPSVHSGVVAESTGTTAVYRWYAPDGSPAEPGRVPAPGELAELPPAWVAGLAEGAAAAGVASADPAAGGSMLEQICEDYAVECAELTSARLYAVDEVGNAEAGSRHDTMTERVHHVVHLAAAGHAGGGHAVLELRELWQRLTASEGREAEFERMLLTSARKAVTAYGQHRVPRDPCLTGVGSGIGGPAWPTTFAPADPNAVDGAAAGLEPAEPPRWASSREVIGAHAFDPNAGLDQALAERVLERTYPVVRFAYDAEAWLLRAPERWELHKRLSPWAVATVATLMPLGDPTAEKGTEQHERSKRRTRLMSTAGARAIAGKMDDLVAGGMHPAAIALADLDADPDVLWAGSMPWSLRSSVTGPAFADLDPATPHLHTASVTPDPRPTPLWDAFLAAVWPDPQVRAWAVRVLSIALTGHADRALPILLGETGRGKTQVVALLMSVLGTYAHAADPRLMSEAGEKAHASIVFALKGRRLSFIDEGPREGRWAQERLKQLTGGGELTANQMNQNPITFRPTHTLVLTTNDEPVLTDPAVRSRVRLIPCEGDAEEIRATRAAIGHLRGAAWRTEAPGVLASMMAEAAGWLAEPTTAAMGAAPEHIRHLADHVGAEQDPIAAWVTEETEPFEPGTPSRELYQEFRRSSRANGVRVDQIPSETKWGRALTRLGLPPFHTEHGKRRALRLRQGGFVTQPVTQPTVQVAPPAPPAPDGLHGSPDGFLTGSDPLPVSEFPQVRPNVSVSPDGSDGLVDPPTHMRAPAPTREQRGEFAPNPSGDPSANPADSASDLRKLGPDGLEPGEPALFDPPAALQKTPVEPQEGPRRKAKSAEATARAAEVKAAQRAAAIAEASGPTIGLPALVTRDGRVAHVDADAADRLLATITGPSSDRAAGALTVDVEHTGYPVGHEHHVLRTVQLGGEHFALVLDPGEQEQADVVRRHLEAATVLHAHSASADLVPLAHAGLIDADAGWAKMLDTGTLAKLADPSSTGNDADLKNLAKNVLGEHALSPVADEARAALFKAGRWLTDTKLDTPTTRSGWAQVDHHAETMIRYDAADVLDDAALAARLPRPGPEVLERELLAQRMTARISHRGIRLDGDQVARLLDEHRTARDEQAARVRDLGRLGEAGNPGSPKQLAEAFDRLGVPLPRTKAGNPSVAKGAIEQLSRDEGQVGDLVRGVLAWRHHNTALTLLLEPWHELVTRGDGRARPTIHTLGADTGRMSCVRPNVQQVSRTGGMRACFTADPGHKLISVDFAGVELRVAAALSGDAGLAAIMGDANRDLHWEVARLAFGPQATKADRYAIKRGVFGRIYGGGVNAVANGVGVRHDVAQRVIDAMDTLTPVLAAWSNEIKAAVEAGRTRFPAYSGRVIHLPERAPHAAPNYCIQGTARELLIDALVRWSGTRWGTATLFPVHDELVVVVPADEAEDATAELVRCMTSELAGVPIVAEASEPSFEWKDSS